jgi:hypothetical protein
MFNLESSHLSALIPAIIFVSFMLVAYRGLVKSTLGFLMTICLIPIVYCTVSLFLPFKLVWILNYIVYGAGFIIGAIRVARFDWVQNYKKVKNYFIECEKWEKFTIVFCVLHMGSMLIGSTVFHGQGNLIDAMAYHLGAPKEWAIYLEGVHLNPNNPEAFTASYFEYIQYSVFLLVRPLYTYLLPLKEMYHEYLLYVLLLSAQIFSALIGSVFIPLLAFKLFGKEKKLGYLLIVVILSLKGINWTWRTAKNDAFSLYCALVAYYYFKSFFSENKERYKTIFISFLILAIGLGSKLTNLYPMVAILVFLFVDNYKKYIRDKYSNVELLKMIIWAAVTGIIGLLPFLIRNYVESGNPLYPTGSKTFPNIYLADKMLEIHKNFSHPTTWHNAWEKLVMLFRANTMLIPIALLSLYLKRLKELFFFVFVSFVISKITGSLFVWRQVSMLIFFIAIWVVKLYSDYIFKNLKWKKRLSYLLIFVVIGLAQFKPERFVKYPVRHYGKTLGEVLPKQYYAMDELLKENMENRLDREFLTNYNSYFSRFNHLNLADSREEHRTIGTKK